MGDVIWEYDLSRIPFRINIRNKSGAVGSEMRANRNIRTITKTIDKSRLYTRFFPIGKDDLHIPGDCVTRNVDLYGAIDHVETDMTIEDVNQLISWANEGLDVHAEPAVKIEIEGLDLSQSTGESLDSFTIGRICRVPLPEFGGAVIKERISELKYQDKITQPEVVQVTLCNEAADITHERGLAEVLAEEDKSTSSGGRGGRGAAKQQQEDHAWFEDTDEHVAMCARGIIGTDDEGNPNWELLSEIVVDGTGVHQHVVEVHEGLVVAEANIENNGRMISQEVLDRKEGDIENRSLITHTATEIRAEVTNVRNGLYSTISQTATEIRTEVANTASGLNSKIDQTATQIRTEVNNTAAGLQSSITQNANSITAEVTRAKDSENSLSGRIQVNANQITAEVTRATNSENSLSGRITVNANKVALVVTEKEGQNVVNAASIVAGINGQSGSYVKIEAEEINLSGYVTANELSVTNAKIANLESGATTATSLKATAMATTYMSVYSGGSFSLFGEYASWKKLEYKNHSGTDITMYVVGRDAA